MTFSLVFVLTLALVAGPAFAQTMTLSAEINGTAGNLDSKDFVVVVNGTTNGIVGTDVNQVTALATDLNDLFAFGGTIELVSTNADADLRITEIMWGIDAAGTGAAQAAPQWIEIYNAGADLTVATTTPLANSVRLLFTTNQRWERDEVTLATTGSAVPDAGAVTAPAADALDNAKITLTVHDRVSVINRFGSRWAPKGQSGRLTADADNPLQNLVSMYRKRSTNAAKDGYKYKANGDPDGDKFGDGTEAGQWIASIGRLNMSGSFIGTPGEVQQDDGGELPSAKDPASLPATAIIINEIFNSDGLQWVELHNTGSATVNVKNWELEAVNGTNDLQRVLRF